MKGGIITKVKKTYFSYALFGVVCLLALINTFYTTEYVSNIAKAAIVPLFLIGIIDFMYKIKDKAEQILLVKKSALPMQITVKLKPYMIVLSLLKMLIRTVRFKRGKKKWKEKVKYV